MATPKKKPEVKMGRPTLYRPEYCGQVLELMSKGKSLTGTAGAMGFWPDLFYEWAKKHADFAEALKAGRAARVSVLEDELMAHGANKDMGKITARIFALKCANSDDWRERPTDQAVNVQINEIKLKIVDPKR
jgi:hypothetical protein